MLEQSPLQVAVGVITNFQAQVLVALRHRHAHQGGLWEFPGGKLNAQETVFQALAREFREELGITISAAEPLITIRHDYADLSVQLNVLRITQYSGKPQGCEGQEIQWVAVNELKKLSFPEANTPIITALQLPDYYAILDSATLCPLASAREASMQVQFGSPAGIIVLLSNLQKLLEQGIKLIQARLKTLSVTQIEHFLTEALPLCKKFAAQLLLNATEPISCKSLAGIHLTSDALMLLRQRPANIRWLAASCHNLAQLQQAQRIGVDFIVLGSVQRTLTHPDAEVLGWDRFAALVAEMPLPVYALGGLQKADLVRAKQCGAQGIAGIRLFKP